MHAVSYTEALQAHVAALASIVQYIAAVAVQYPPSLAPVIV